jgi:hypothetical protein
VASRRRTNVAGVTGALCLARSATVRRRSRRDDDTPGPNSAKTMANARWRVLCVDRRGNSFRALVAPRSAQGEWPRRVPLSIVGREFELLEPAGRRWHAVQEPSTAPKVRAVARGRQNLEPDLRGMESRDGFQTLARARHSQSKVSKTSVGESDSFSGSVAETEALTTRVLALASH